MHRPPMQLRFDVIARLQQGGVFYCPPVFQGQAVATRQLLLGRGVRQSLAKQIQPMAVAGERSQCHPLHIVLRRLQSQAGLRQPAESGSRDALAAVVQTPAGFGQACRTSSRRRTASACKRSAASSTQAIRHSAAAVGVLTRVCATASSTVSSRSCPIPVMTGKGNCAHAAASR